MVNQIRKFEKSSCQPSHFYNEILRKIALQFFKAMVNQVRKLESPAANHRIFTIESMEKLLPVAGYVSSPVRKAAVHESFYAAGFRAQVLDKKVQIAGILACNIVCAVRKLYLFRFSTFLSPAYGSVKGNYVFCGRIEAVKMLPAEKFLYKFQLDFFYLPVFRHGKI